MREVALLALAFVLFACSPATPTLPDSGLPITDAAGVFDAPPPLDSAPTPDAVGPLDGEPPVDSGPTLCRDRTCAPNEVCLLYLIDIDGGPGTHPTGRCVARPDGCAFTSCGPSHDTCCDQRCATDLCGGLGSDCTSDQILDGILYCN